MESTADFDLEELESKLYSQVFHSTENCDSTTGTQNLNNIQIRHVSAFAISNTNKPVNGNRYWDARTQQDKIQSIENKDNHVTLKENIVNLRNPHETTNIETTSVPSIHLNTNKKSITLDSVIPLETTKVQEYRTKPLKYNKYVIPTTFKLPKSEEKLTDYIINYFNLKKRSNRKNFRSFLFNLERKNNKKRHFLPSTDLDDRIESGSSPLNISIATNGLDRNVNLSDMSIPMEDELSLPKTKKIQMNENEVITLSDSDSDSVIEIPLPPIPVYNVDSSSESDVEEINESISNVIEINKVDVSTSKDKEAARHTLLLKDKISDNENNTENVIEEQIHENSRVKQSLQDRENLDNKQRGINSSITELEKDRDEFLHTPDSNTNDFLEHDVNTLSKSNLSFNFGLHSSDLDLSKDDKEEPVSKSGQLLNDHDLYETESSCSELGSVVSKSGPVFNEITFENPIKDIFYEPNLSKFSNFITPKRSTQTRLQQNKLLPNTHFKPVQTRACRERVKETVEMREENIRRTRSDSSEYHSDATTLKIKKKNKRSKKKWKKKEKQLEQSEPCVLPSEEQSEGNNSKVVFVPPVLLEKTNSKVDVSNSQNKPLSPSEQIENLKINPISHSSADLRNINFSKEITQVNPNKTNLDSSNSKNSCSSISDYYVDTFFADDCLMLDDIEIKNKDVTYKNESSNIQNITVNTNMKIPSALIINEEENMIKTVKRNSETNEIIIKDDHNSTTNDNATVNFSFVDTWRKSTDKNFNTDEKRIANKTEIETSPNKKLKTDNSPTVHPYVVTVESSDDSNESAKNNEKNYPKSITLDEKSFPDLLIVNVKDNKINSESTTKRKSPKNNIVANPFSFINTFCEKVEKKSFKDFRTQDMEAFYNESWGQENYDLNRAYSSMSDKASDWKIIPADIFQMAQRRRGPMCRRCREFGHTQHNCSRFITPLKCTTCGIPGHFYYRCPNSFCTSCRKPTDHFTSSCRNCVHYKNIICNLCKNIGHEMRNCPDLWRRYHLTTESHSELKTSSSVLKSQDEQWCANCAKRGHFDNKCNYLRPEHFPLTPEIISYEPTYQEVFKLPVTPTAPNIPILKNAHVTISDLRTIKKDVIESSNQKYINILKQLRQQCNKYDFQLIHQIEQLQRNINNQVFDKRKIREIYKIRANIARNRIL